jgi:type I restriction enzyme, S subunit
MKHARIGDHVEPVDTWNPQAEGGGSTFRYIDIAAVSQDEKAVTTAQVIEAAEAPSRARQIVKAGDVLVSTVRPNLNAVAVVPDVLDGATASTGFTVLRPDNRGLASSYLFHWVRSPTFVAEMTKLATGQSYPAVNDRIVKGSTIPLPPLDEQRRIAGILDQADALRRLRTRALDRLNTLGQAIFHEMFGDMRTNELGWQEGITLGELADVVSGITKGRKVKSENLREVPYLAVSNVQDRFLKMDVVKTIEATEDEIDRYKLRRDDLLLTEGGDPDKLGRGTLWKEQLPECIHQNHVFRVRVTDGRVRPTFLSWQLGSERGKQYFLRSAKQTTGIASINKTQINAFPLVLPPVALQLQFEERLTDLEERLCAYETAKGQSEFLFTSLQHRAFRGEL